MKMFGIGALLLSTALFIIPCFAQTYITLPSAGTNLTAGSNITVQVSVAVRRNINSSSYQRSLTEHDVDRPHQSRCHQCRDWTSVVYQWLHSHKHLPRHNSLCGSFRVPGTRNRKHSVRELHCDNTNIRGLRTSGTWCRQLLP